MVYGIIHDFYTAIEGAEKSVVKFIVKSDEESMATACTVCAEIPNDALKYDMVKTGSSIGWEEPKVYIEIEGVEDVPFDKVNNPAEAEVAFSRDLPEASELEEKGSNGI